MSQVEADTAIYKASALASKASRELQTRKGPFPLKSTFFFERAGPEGMGPGPAEMFSTHTTERPSEGEEVSDRTGIRVFSQGWDHTRAQQRNQPNSQSEKFFLPKVYSRKHSASPSYLNGYCCLRAAGYARLLPGIQLTSTQNLQYRVLVPHTTGPRKKRKH